MTTEDFKRKLTAILSADVVGYSHLMGDDEEGTVRTLNKYKEYIFSLIDKNNGRVIDSPGDNVLAEFASVVDAVRCGVQIQEDLKASNKESPTDRKMEFRIGINTGDVIQDGDRIYGDGVNVAARIESLADPGGICISGLVYTQVKNRLNLNYEFQGKQSVKNISDPIPVYRVKYLTEIIIDQDANNEPIKILSDKPSIVVLPFVNISGDHEQEYFSDGMTEELINVLANVEGLKVISRTSSFFFKGKDINLRNIGKELNIENVLEGSVRKAGNKIRITAQLIKVADDTHLWSETYDRELEDVFAIQDEISKAIVDSLKIRLFRKEKETFVKSYTESIEAYEAYLKGRYYYSNLMKDSMEKALQYYKQAITLDPTYAPAYSAIGEYFWQLPYSGNMNISNDEVYTYAREAINTALEIDNSLSEAHSTMGLIKFSYEWDWKGAEEAIKTAIKLNPGLSKPHYDYAWYLAMTGNADKSILEARKAIELDPFYAITHWILGICFYSSGQFDKALKEIQQAHQMIRAYPPLIFLLVKIYIYEEMFEEAMDEIKKGLEFFKKYPGLLRLKGHIHARKGEKDKTREILHELLERSKKEYVSPFDIAPLYDDLGEIDKAYEYLEMGYNKRDINLPYILITYRGDPRFEAFFKKIGL